MASIAPGTGSCFRELGLGWGNLKAGHLWGESIDLVTACDRGGSFSQSQFCSKKIMLAGTALNANKIHQFHGL